MLNWSNPNLPSLAILNKEPPASSASFAKISVISTPTLRSSSKSSNVTLFPASTLEYTSANFSSPALLPPATSPNIRIRSLTSEAVAPYEIIVLAALCIALLVNKVSSPKALISLAKTSPTSALPNISVNTVISLLNEATLSKAPVNTPEIVEPIFSTALITIVIGNALFISCSKAWADLLAKVLTSNKALPTLLSVLLSVLTLMDLSPTPLIEFARSLKFFFIFSVFAIKAL
uniref:Uncharacterized protein n=1 Tax=Borrelia miyamotoi TaxID=47466 RepID=A0A481YDP0_9SPIR|nr:hypothetical protein EZU67_05815 [Borrelia miyamotoi]